MLTLSRMCPALGLVTGAPEERQLKGWLVGSRLPKQPDRHVLRPYIREPLLMPACMWWCQ